MAQVSVLKRFTYDHTGRILKTFHQINSNKEVLLSSLKYNEIGQIVEKNLHSENNASFLQSIDYRYNIRGWLKTINNSQLTNDMSTTVNSATNPYILISKTNDDANDLFGMELVYDSEIKSYNGSTYSTLNTQKYNGQLSAVKWQVSGSHSGFTSERTYLYNYDPLNRLLSAVHASFSSTWTLDGNKLKEEIPVVGGIPKYDDNSNILQLNRYDANGTQIDQLTYNYTGSCNQISDVTDAQNNTAGFSDGVNTPGAEYAYNDNGSATKDLNKGIQTIEYNVMNLVRKVTFTNSSTILFTYNAAGQMLRRQETISGVVTTTDFVDGFYYVNSMLNYLATSEGRVDYTNSTNSWNYVYNIQDHLGNVRVSFDKDPSTGLARLVQEEHFYPYGLRHGSWRYGNGTDFLLTGKEWLGTLAWYDFGARMQDPSLGRWFVQDPLYQDFSPYVYCGANPANNYDPNGMSWFTDAGNWLDKNVWQPTGKFFSENWKPVLAGVEIVGGVVLIVVAAAAEVVSYGGLTIPDAFLVTLGCSMIGNGIVYFCEVADGMINHGMSWESANDMATFTFSVTMNISRGPQAVPTTDPNGEPIPTQPTAPRSTPVTPQQNRYTNPPELDLNNATASLGGGGPYEGDVSLSDGADYLLFIKTAIFSGVETIVTKYGGPAESYTKNIGTYNKWFGGAATVYAIYQYIREPTPINLGKALLNGLSIFVPPTPISYLLTTGLAIADMMGALDGIYNNPLFIAINNYFKPEIILMQMRLQHNGIETK